MLGQMQQCLSFAAQFCITTKESEFQLFAKLCVDGQKNCISKHLFMLWSSSILGKTADYERPQLKELAVHIFEKKIKSQKYCKSRTYLTRSNKCFVVVCALHLSPPTYWLFCWLLLLVQQELPTGFVLVPCMVS